MTKPANTNASEEEQLAKSSTRFWHSCDCRCNHDDHGRNQIDDLAFGVFAALGRVFCFLVLELFPAGGEQITFGRVLFMLFHQAEIEAYNGGEEHHIQG